MWNADSNDGIPKEAGWQSGLEHFKLKIPIAEYLDEVIGEHMWDNHQDWCESQIGQDFGVETKSEVHLYLNVNSKNGDITVCGVDGHPLDLTKRLK